MPGRARLAYLARLILAVVVLAGCTGGTKAGEAEPTVGCVNCPIEEYEGGIVVSRSSAPPKKDAGTSSVPAAPMAPADLNDGYAASGEVTAEEPASPASFLMPALEGERMVSPRPMAWTLSAAPDDTIVYSFLTPEGTQVTNRSKGIAFLPTMMPGTRLIWYAENQSSPGEAHARRFEVNEQLQEDAGFLAEQVRPKGRESWTEAKGGQVISLGMNLQHWAPANCPRCIMQVVTLIDGVPSACIINDIPGTWPGVSYDFTVNARMPTAPGSHRVQAKFTLQYTCAAALREAANDPENATTLAVVNVR